MESNVAMEVAILAGLIEIGTAKIAAWDYGMGVAGGAFMPGPAFAASDHAAMIDGKRVSGTRLAQLAVRSMDGELISCEFVAICDSTATVGPDALEVEIYGLDLVRHFGPEPIR